MDERSTGENLSKGNNTTKIIKGALGVVVGIGKRTVGALDNNQSDQNHNKDKNNENLIQYTFPFASGISQLGDTDRNNIQKQLGATAVKARIYCIRHGMSVQEENHRKLPAERRKEFPLSQTADTPLCEDAKVQYRENAEKLIKLGINNQNTYLLYCEETEDGNVVRIAESAGLIAEGIGIQPERILNTISGLDTTDKDDDVVHRRISLTKTISIDFAAQLLEKLGSNTVSDINIICIIHKSNIEGIKEGIFQNKEDAESHLPKIDEIETGEMTFVDVDMTGKPLNYEIRLEVLKFDQENYESIFDALKGEKKLQNIFTLFNARKIQIWELQNSINAYFHENSEAFSRFLNDKNSSIHLRVFCLTNMVIRKDYTTIEKYYLSGECTHLSNKEKMIFLKHIEKPEVMKIFRRLFVSKQKLWEDEESKLFTDAGQTEFYTLLKQSRLAHTTATGLQSNSLDPLIKTGKENAVIERQLYYEEEEDRNPDIQKEQLEKKIVQRDFDPDMFLKGGDYSKFIIRAHVGEGKSIYLSELVKQFSIEEDKEMKFVIAKNLKEEDIKEVFSDTQAIVCIDALDEANEVVRNRIKEEFRNFEGRCIVSTRHSESFQGDEKTCILYFRSLDSTKYIDSRFGEDITKATEVKKWIEQHGLSNEVKGNPLLLNLIVLLASASDEDRKWMDGYKILQYNQIKTKSELYENVVRFVLAKHSKEIKNQDFDPNEDLTAWMERLGEYAFDLFSNIPEKNTKKYFDSHLSILFKSEKNGEYNFIHKSFYEYFLARHLAKIENGKGSQSIYSYRDGKMKGNWNDWREFRQTVLFYAEELIKYGKYDELVSFLGENGLLNNDDMFGENFFIGLEILYKIPEKVRITHPINRLLGIYKNTVSHWKFDDIFLRLNLIKRFTNNIGYTDTEVSRIILQKFFENLKGNGYDNIYFYTKIIGLNIPEGINACLEGVKILMRNKDYRNIGEIYCELVKTGNPEGIKEVIAGMKVLMENKETYHFGEIYCELVKTGNPEWIKETIIGTKVLIEKGNPYQVYKSYSELVKTGNPEWIKEILDGIKKFMENKNYGRYGWIEMIYSELVKTGDPEWIKEVLEGAREFMRKEEYNIALKIYSELVKTGNPEWIKESIVGAKISMESRGSYEKYGGISHIYLELVKTGDPEWIKEAIIGAKILIHNNSVYGTHHDALVIYCEIIKTGNSELIKEAINGLRRKRDPEIYCMFVKTGNPKLINEVLDEIKYVSWFESGVIYWELVKTGDPEWIKEALKGLKILIKHESYTSIFNIYLELVKTGDPEWIKEVLNGMNSIKEKERIDHESYTSIFNIYLELVKTGDPEWIKEVLNGMNSIKEKERILHYSTINAIYYEIVKVGNPKLLEKALNGAKGFMKKGKYNDALKIYEELYELPRYIYPYNSLIFSSLFRYFGLTFSI